jgi:hypothetical protein
VSTTASGVHEQPAGFRRRLSSFFYHHPRWRLAALLALPVGWLVVGYLGSLAIMLAGLRPDRSAGCPEPRSTAPGFWRSRAGRHRETVSMAAAVALACVSWRSDRLSMARIASPVTRRLLIVAILVLWRATS